MKNEPAWSDLALFAAVARAGGLSAAVDATGASAATLSRRMKALEAELGRRLFLHGRQGYCLTADGRALLEKTEAMEAAAAEIAAWRSAQAGPPRVRISAGTWTSRYLAQHVSGFWAPGEPWVPEFVHCDLPMDIARREIDVGIRNKRPEQPWLAGQKTGDVDYAVYAAASDVRGWIGMSGAAAALPSARWAEKAHGDAFVTSVNDPRLALTLAEQGVGRVVLPIFVGDASALARLSAPIAELSSEEWLVTHHEGRYEPPVRHAIRRLRRFLGRGKAPVDAQAASA